MRVFPRKRENVGIIENETFLKQTMQEKEK